jgi:hypothetical protein
MKKFTEALQTHHQLKPARETQQQQLNVRARHLSAASPAPAEVARARGGGPKACYRKSLIPSFPGAAQ